MWEDLYYFPWKNRNALFHGELVGFSHCDGTYYQARRESDVTVLEYVIKGSGTVKVNGTAYQVNSGDIYLLPLYTDHIYYCSNDDPWEKIFINVRGVLPSELINQYQFQLQYIFHGSHTKELFYKLYDYAKKEMNDELRQELFASLFLRILIRLQNQTSTNLKVDEALLIKNIIDNAPNKIYSIDELADKLNRSKDFIIKTFQQHYSVTPHAYITSRKIETAKMLLAETNLRIQEIAFSLGYQNAEHFSTQFKKHCGVSPKSFRNMCKI